MKNEALLAQYDIRLCRMIYLLRKHDIISVPIIREAYIIRNSGYHRVSDIIRFRRERISLKKSACKASGFFLVGEDGFEPSKRNAADLQSVPFGHSGTPPDMWLCLKDLVIIARISDLSRGNKKKLWEK